MAEARARVEETGVRWRNDWKGTFRKSLVLESFPNQQHNGRMREHTETWRRTFWEEKFRAHEETLSSLCPWFLMEPRNFVPH